MKLTNELVPQSYGIAMSQVTFGGPRGVWLECTSCNRSDRIAGARATMTDRSAAKIFRKGGWTGQGDRMSHAKCPSCSSALSLEQGEKP